MNFSVIVLNYQGRRVIKDTLEALEKQNYNRTKYEIIVVDNLSTDKSMEIVEDFIKRYGNIVPIYNNDNYGFSKGNNIGIKASRGKYVCLLNNDCVPDKNWLSELEKTFEKNKNIFALNSKIMLYPKFTNLNILKKDEDTQNIYLIRSRLLNYSTEKKIKLSLKEDGLDYFIEIPHAPGEKEVTIKIGDNKKIIKISKSFSKIQNAGSLVFQDGYGRDIGAKVKGHMQDYEIDIGQYEKTREVFSTCAAAVAYRRSVLNKVGVLDENFFMYYEDTEISERARLMGYINYYEPKAVARHLHAYSSKEWSNFFIFNVEKGHLLHMAYHFPLISFLFQFIIAFAKSFTNQTYKKIILWFLLNSPKIALKRVAYESKYKLSRQKLLESITSGYWYEN